MKNIDEDFLATKIVSNKNFANSYQLCKVLAWKFDIINCNEVIKRIESQEFITMTFPKNSTMGLIHLTIKGMELLDERGTEVREILKKEFPNEIEFINNIFSSDL